MDIAQTAKKIPFNLRLSEHVAKELQSIADTSRLDKTEIVETAIMNVRKVIEADMRKRADKLKSLPK